MKNIEVLRSLQADPVLFAAALGPYIHPLGVTAEIQQDPAGYIEQVQSLNPRYLDEKGIPTPHSISRQTLQKRAGDVSLDPQLERYGQLVGLIDADYSFDDHHNEADLILVTGGVMTAIEARARFAKSSNVDAPILVAGSPRKQNKAEHDLLTKMGLNPDDYPTEREIARLVLHKLKLETDERLRLFSSDATYNEAMIIDVINQNPDMSQLSVITTDLYVPFTAMDAGTAQTKTGRQVAARAYAGVSAPEAVAKRNNKTYLTELFRSLRGAANWVSAIQDSKD